ncbi:MAG: hypothetical protein ACFFBR_00300 [Promethearchaeota archaeon]
MNLNCSSLLTMVILFIFFLEIIITLRIYRKYRSHHKSKTLQNQSFLIIENPSQSRQKIPTDQPISDFDPQLSRLLLTDLAQSSSKQGNHRFNSSICLLSVFTVTFLLINYSLRPFIYAWTLLLVPIIIPLPFLVLPALFELKSYTTLGSLLFGLGFGAVVLLLFLE